MKLSDLKTVVEVLESYGNESVSAEHDELFLGGPPPDEIGDIHRQLLELSGASWNEEYECWSVFT